MSQVKIKLEKGETMEQVKEDLIKAFTTQSSGVMHTADRFEDKAMDELHQKLLAKHKNIMGLILKEIDKLLKDVK